jgi:hypothetical protein
MKKMLGFIVLIWFTTACVNTDSGKTFPAFYAGTYSFSSVESMALGVWLLPDSTFLLLKKIDNDTLFHGVFGNWKCTDDIFQLNSGNAGLLVVKFMGNKLEVLNNEGGQIGREPKFILSQVEKNKTNAVTFSAAAKVITSEAMQPQLQFCNTIKYWNLTNDKVEIESLITGIGVSESISEVIVLLKANDISGNQIQVIGIQKQSARLNCDN